MPGLGSIAGVAGGTALGGPIGGVIGGAIGGAFDGMFNGDNPLEFWIQLDRNDVQSQAYFTWCSEFAPGIIASGDVWGPASNGIEAFRAKWGPNVQKYRDYCNQNGLAIVGVNGVDGMLNTGSINANMDWIAPEVDADGNIDSPGITKDKKSDMSTFVMLWPWSKGVWVKDGPIMWYHWLLWVLIFIVGPVLLFMLLKYWFKPARRAKRRGKRKARRASRRSRSY